MHSHILSSYHYFTCSFTLIAIQGSTLLHSQFSYFLLIFFCLLELTTFIIVVYVMNVFLFKHLTLFFSPPLFLLHYINWTTGKIPFGQIYHPINSKIKTCLDRWYYNHAFFFCCVVITYVYRLIQEEVRKNWLKWEELIKRHFFPL